MTSLQHSSSKQSPDQEKKPLNPLYRRAILSGLDDLRDVHSRSNLDLIRGRTRAILEDTNHIWNELIFIHTVKILAESGEIIALASSWAELSPTYKRKRAESLSQQRMEDGPNSSSASTPPPPLPPITTSPHPCTTIITTTTTPEIPFFNFPSSSPILHEKKLIPVRKPENEKWKIMPKKIYDKTIIVNPMDTH